ncbi:MAG: right-handed parallel beta-helix repeat-containing protein, partial [Candidatus Bathyarchaeota archaeon]|nr:right-handed parallel beta-helix repeat-containing protein [Candidatus Bathyarchaeota archaeon]
MRSCLKLLPLLVIVAFGAFANSLLFLDVSATYVEGEITQDTIWTLTDSPFVVSKDVTIYSGATLTMEPGIEVKFGGNFSLIVNGRLSAKGTQDNVITFTSNKDQPGASDWNTIQFSGTLQSELIYCSIKYATNGITVENGDIRIENCEISTNFRNGFTIVNSRAEVENNEITSNFENGIYITGDNDVAIQNNTIRSNRNGIVLAGDSTTGVSITGNTVISNIESGIQLNAKDYNNVVILKNVLSANNHGFYVSGQASTYIRNNSISYNVIGISYRGVQNYAGIQAHEAHWNDIYGNELGVDILSGADIIVIVDAEYNYWGDESGPYHRSLNPDGKGNPVGGDGVNLDFVFFLTAPIGYINQRPTARLLTDKKVVLPNHAVTFIGTTSSDDRQVDQYFYDFGDGETSGWTSLSIFVHE